MSEVFHAEKYNSRVVGKLLARKNMAKEGGHNKFTRDAARISPAASC